MRLTLLVIFLLNIFIKTAATEIRVANNRNEAISVFVTDYDIKTGKLDTLKGVVVSSNSTSTIRFDAPKRLTFLTIKVNKQRLEFLVSATDNITIQFLADTKIAFQGKGYEQYEYLNSVDKIIQRRFFPSHGNAVHDLNEKDYELLMNNLETDLGELSSRYLPLFSDEERSVLNNYCFYKLLAHKQNRQEAYFSFWSGKYELAPRYLQNLEDKVKMDSVAFQAEMPDYLMCIGYTATRLVQNNFNNLTYQGQEPHIKQMEILFDKVDSLKFSKEIREYILAKNLSDFVKLGSISDFFVYQSRFLEKYPETQYSQLIVKNLSTSKSLSTGEYLPEFTGYTSTGKSLTLSDFLGKYIYLDLWATWCGPCIIERTTLKHISIEFKQNDDLVFINLSLDRNAEKWRSFLRNDTGGNETDLIIGSSLIEDIYKRYNIVSVPKYMLIGKDGKVIDSNAPRPSDQKLKDTLQSLLNE